ncbi:MAG: DCC1-like thiol-disulfide oxidoreductase family protein [Vicingaceae bacterium]|nr:DCC1-like thiol-disulfide oxidoreductase family protein [Vicingaceae bacterium]
MGKQHAIILFDGDCNFCNYWVKYIIERDKKDLFRFTSLQSETGKDLLKKYDLKDDLETVVLIKNNKAKTKSTAALHIFKGLGSIYQLAIIFIVVPTFIRDAVYSLVAKYRKQLMKSQSCIIPTQAVKNKFLE